MSSIQIKSNVTVEELLQGIVQLEGQELDDFIQKILSIRAKRRSADASLEKRESELLELIAKGPSEEIWKHFQELNKKRREEALSNEEHQELIKINTELEAWNVQRLKYLSELALLRNTDLRSLMNELGITPFDG